MAHWIKLLAAGQCLPNEQSSIPGTHIKVGENYHPELFSAPHAHAMVAVLHHTLGTHEELIT